MIYRMIWIALLVIGCGAAVAEPVFLSKDIFPLQAKHVHGSSIVQTPNGDFLACWFQGSGERSANDVAVNGARLAKGKSEWSPVFPMADTPGFPDCNPVLYVDRQERLWMFWVTVMANQWESSLLKYRRADHYQKSGPPEWSWQDVIMLEPGEAFAETMKAQLKEAKINTEMWAGYAQPYEEIIVAAAGDKLKRQIGWMTRIHPYTLPSGRILLPLYSDGFNACLMALSDDTGATWRASKPICGQAPIQPTIVRKKTGGLTAFFRDSGGVPHRVQVASSSDDGENWTVSKDTEIPNPGSSLEVIELKDGAWLMVANDTEDSRGRLTALLSDDEGATWKWKRQIEPSGYGDSFAYPSVILGRDGLVHMTYSVAGKQGATIRSTVINEEWMKAGQ